jgi:hypothetical protein
MPPKVEAFNVAQAANEVIEIEDSIKRCAKNLARKNSAFVPQKLCAIPFWRICFLLLSGLKVANNVQSDARPNSIGDGLDQGCRSCGDASKAAEFAR